MSEYYPIERLYRIMANMHTFTIGKRRAGAIWESSLFDVRLVEKAKKTHMNVSRETLERK